jgi:hypothetical protein
LDLRLPRPAGQVLAADGLLGSEVEDWLSAGCALPFAAAALRDSYISRRLAAQQTDGADGPPATIAFKCATMQLS